MTQFSGEERFTQPRTEIWSRLIDAEFLAQCMPGLESVERDDSALLVCRVRPGLSFLKGAIRVTLEVYDKQPPDSLRIRVHSKGIGSSAIVETAVELAALDTGTQLAWTAAIAELGGLLKPVSRGLIEAAARKVIAEGWTGFKDGLR